MGFFFQPRTSADISVSTYPDSQGTDEALLNDNIWHCMQDEPEGRLAIAIAPFAHFIENNSDPSALKSLTCWTQPASVSYL